MKPALRTAGLVLLLAAIAASDSLATPATDARNQKTDELFAAWAKRDSPGAALAVLKDGQVVYEKGYGMADLERDVAITPATVFDIGSTSKQFTAASVLLLARQGKLSLDDEVQKYIPELPRYPQKVTIRHLVHHTSGIRDYLVLMALAGLRDENEYSERQVLDLLARQKELNFKPGDEHLYSNSGYFLLSVVVKRASGKTLREFAEENIFRPLGMTRTHFHDDFTEIVKSRALAYSPRDKKGYALNLSLFDVVGDGCLFTTVGDLAKWDENFYQNKLAGEQGLIEQMHSPGKLNNGTVLSYAFGLFVGNYRGLPTESHGGAWAGYRAELLRFPPRHFSVIVLSNRADANPTSLARKVADIYLADQLAQENPDPKGGAPVPDSRPPKTPISIAAEILKSYVGEYELAPGFVLKVTVEADHLFAQATGQDRFELFAESTDTFFLKEVAARLRFVKQPNTKLAGELVLHQNGRDMPGTRVDPVAPLSAKALNDLSGDYTSEELAVTYTVGVKDGGLVLTSRASLEEMPLRNAGSDRFNAPARMIAFERNTRKQVTGFSLDAGRVKNLKFVKRR